MRSKASGTICPMFSVARKDFREFNEFFERHEYNYEYCLGSGCAFWSRLGGDESEIGNCGISKFMQILEDK